MDARGGLIDINKRYFKKRSTHAHVGGPRPRREEKKARVRPGKYVFKPPTLRKTVVIIYWIFS